MQNPLSKLSPVSLYKSASLRSCLAAAHKMELDNITAQEDATKGSALEALFEEHHVALVIVCISSLILGIPLLWNVLWHLKESLSNVKYIHHSK